MDIYHLENQTVRGFCDTLVAEFSEHQSEFENYKKYTRLLDDAYVLADYDKAVEFWKKAERALSISLSRLTRDSFGRDRPLWIIIDTAEMLYLQTTQHDAPKIGTDRLSLWLPTFLPLLRGQPIILILAGRPPEKQNYPLLDVLSERVKAGWLIAPEIYVESLGAKACGQYLQEVSNRLANEHYDDGAEKIRTYLKRNNLKDLARETKGEPLALAMTCDILRTGGALPVGFFGVKENIDVPEKKTLMEHYLNLETPLGMTVEAMAVLRKGTDAKLLSAIMGIKNKEEVKENLGLAAKLTLVKTRLGPNKRRYFLHDEVYDLYASQIPKSTAAWADMFESIKNYYDEELTEIETRMEKNPKQLRYFQSEYRRTQVELMHYVLWFYPWRGFGEYFQQSVEATGQKIQDWNNLLSVEWERTCRILEKENRYPLSGFDQHLKWDDDIKQIDSASTWAELNSDIRAIGVKSKKITFGCLQQVDQAPLLYQAYIWLVRGLLVLRNQQPRIEGDTFASCMKKARVALGNARAGDFREELYPALKFLEAYTYNYEGMMRRRQGNYQGALDVYYRAGVEMRKRKLGGLSTVLINQAYAMSMLGYDQRARETSLEAYDLAVPPQVKMEFLASKIRHYPSPQPKL